jgi:hypothetical protein
MDIQLAASLPLWVHCWWYNQQLERLVSLAEEDAELAYQQYLMLIEQEEVIKNYDKMIKSLTWPTLN